MPAHSALFVTLSADLLIQLRARAARSEVSLEWIVAGLVCETVERFADECSTRTASNSTLLLPVLNGSGWPDLKHAISMIASDSMDESFRVPGITRARSAPKRTKSASARRRPGGRPDRGE